MTYKSQFRKFLSLFAFTAIMILLFSTCSFSKTKDKVLEFLNQLPGKTVTQQGDTHTINNPELLKKYYEQQATLKTLAEKDERASKDRQTLLEMLRYADSLGLDSEDYHEKYLRDYDKNIFNPGYNYETNLISSEIVIADAALSFLFDVAYGKNIEQIQFNGVDLNIDSTRIFNALSQLLTERNWHKVIDTLEPKMREYVLLKSAYNHMRIALMKNADIDVLHTDDQGVSAVTKKLKVYGLVDATTNSLSDTAMQAALKTFQRITGIDTSGKLDKRTIAELNFPLKKRVLQLKTSLNYWRWTGRLKEQEFIFVNIPAAQLRIINRSTSTEANMRVILGKAETRTPSFTAYISKVITYPYWTVPFSIATKEILPKLKRDRGYLERNNFQVLNRNGTVIDPHSINWHNVNKKNFHYVFRQSTGCDNALGVMKFDLNSPYSIYLHDTNNRNLFARDNRHLSHGCVRVEQPFYLAEYLLGSAVDTAYLNQCLRTEKPKEFKLQKKFPVLILYLTADVNAEGELRFYKDVYGYEKEI